MDDQPQGTIAASSRAAYISLVASFFLPAIYFSSLMLLRIEGSKVGAASAWVASVLIPVAVVGASMHRIPAKIAQILLGAVAWIVIQLFTIGVIGVVSLMQSGLAGTQ